MNHTYRLVWSPTQQRYVPTAETARSRGKSASGKALLPAAMVLSTALLSSPGFAQAPPALAPNALPTGGQVVAGQASIGQQGSQMTVTQGTDKAILNWNSFNIGQDARVQFQQPGSSAVALNRVVAGDASQIQGQLAANGQVWLINPNGVVFGPGSRVDVGGLVASTLSITDKDFLDSKAIFNRDGATGGIVNEGQITAVGDGERGGLIALLAPTVRNDGVLTAKLGNVALAAGDRITLNAGAGGLLQVEVEPATLRTLVENRQMIVADGGQVVMTGKAADALSASVVANTGTVQARSIATQQGRIMLLGDAEHGSVQVGGVLDASSSSDQLASAQGGQQLNASGSSGQGADVPVSAPWGQGGSIEVTGKHVALAGATLDASGAAGGGDIKVGGGWQGSGTLARAKTTTVDATSRLKADATQKGDGGTVVVWSDDKTRYAGHISAKGGSTGGNGGKAEVSGKAVLDFTGTADLSAAQGRSGDLLLDPYNLTIVAGSGGTPDGSNNFVAAADDSTLGVNTLTNLLATANVTVSTGGTGSPGAQAGNITVNAPVAWSANNVLTLEAAGDIAINQNITATGVSAGLVLSHGTGKDYQLADGASVTLSGTSASLNIGATGALNTYTLLRDVNALQAIPGSSNGRFALAGDIDASPLASGEGFAPIKTFGGTFTGMGHVVTGLTINRPSEGGVGLFGFTNAGSTIRNVGLVGGSVSGGGFTGGLVGNSQSTLAHVYTTGSVHSLSGSVGGLVGYNRGSINHAYATGDVSAAFYVGGLVGQTATSSTITQAYATGTVTGTSFAIGGLVGVNRNIIAQAYATGAVHASQQAGGLVGDQSQGSITDAYATGAVTATDPSTAGGLVGTYNFGPITRSFYATTQADGSAINNAGATAGTWSGNAFGTAKTRADLLNPATFSGLNTAIWNVARGNTAPGYEVGLPALTGVTPAAAIARTTLFQGGMGIAGNPYGITDWQQLANISQVQSGGYTFTLNNSLDSSSSGYSLLASATSNGGLGWKPLGDGGTTFIGTFEGQNQTVSGLIVNRPTEVSVGLFGYVGAGSNIRNLGVAGSILGSYTAGGLAGSNHGTITNSYATGTVRAVDANSGQAGGLVGVLSGAIKNSYATADVVGDGSSGGLVGISQSTASVTESYATGSVTGILAMGGLVGLNMGTIDRAYATGAVNGQTSLGGLAGQNNGSITQSYSTGSVTGTFAALIGGLVGRNIGNVASTNFYATTNTSGNANNNGGVAAGVWTGNTTGTGKTLVELMTPATFASWAANLATAGGSNAIWRIYAGNTTPLLRSFLQAATVTADLSAASKTYNGTIASGTAPFTSNVAGPLLGALSYASNSANAGTYATADSSLQLGGLYSGPQGYDISYAPASLTITPVVLVPGGPGVPGNTPSTITGTLAGTVRKTYDGTNVATLGSGNFQLSGWVSSDGAIVTKTVGRYDRANAGSGKTVTVDLALGDYQATGTTNLGNYLLPTQISGAVGTVDKAALTVSANSASKTYDGQAWRGGNGVSYSGFVNGETSTVLTGAVGYGGTSQGAVEVGNYLLTPQGLNSGNYAIDYRNGTLSVASVAGGNPGGGNPGVGNPGSGSPGTGNPGSANPGGGDAGGGNIGGGSSGSTEGGTGGVGTVEGNSGGNGTGNENAGNGDTFADSGPAPSGSNLWRALNRATPPFMLPQDTDSRREISVPHLSLAPGYIRLQEEESALPREQ